MYPLFAILEVENEWRNNLVLKGVFCTDVYFQLFKLMILLDIVFPLLSHSLPIGQSIVRER